MEFVKDPAGVEIHGEKGLYIPYPIEYKRGKTKQHDADIMQLCAQALCLEEMLLCEISIGYLYYEEIKHRVEVQLTDHEKSKVRAVVKEMYNYYLRGYTPKVKTGAFCRSCSLKDICLPELMKTKSVKRYIEGKILE